MRTAIVLTGHMRCWRQCFSNTKQLIEKYNADVYIHTWDEEAYWAPHSPEGVTKNNSPLDVTSVISTYNPVSIVVEKQQKMMPIIEAEIGDMFENHYHVKKNIVSMLRKMYEGMRILADDYDYVIRMRPDLIFTQRLPELSPDKFYTIQSKNHMGKGTSDIFQAGSFDNMFWFVDVMYKGLPELYEDYGLLCPHELSEYILSEELSYQWEELNVPFTIMHTPMGMYVPESRYR